jgi:hypothetical protein
MADRAQQGLSRRLLRESAKLRDKQLKSVYEVGHDLYRIGQIICNIWRLLLINNTTSFDILKLGLRYTWNCYWSVGPG